MFSHVYVGVNDFERALAFYSGFMAELGMPLRFAEPERAWAGWQPREGARPLFLIGRPYDGKRADPGNGQMVALLAASRTAVDNAFAWAVSNGGTSEGAPGLRTHYHENYYGAYLRDPEGNKLCVCCHHPDGSLDRAN